MAPASVTKCKIWWVVKHVMFDLEYEGLIANHPEAKMEIDQLRATIAQISQLVYDSLEVNVDGAKWEQISDTVQTETEILYKYVHGEALFTALLSLYTSVYKEMRDSLQAKSMEANQEAALQPQLPELDDLLKYKRKIRKSWQETRDPKVKTDLNWVSKTIKRMVRGKRTLTMGHEDSKLGGHTPSNMAYCEVPHTE
jgi:hypothetical protein